MDDIYHDEDKKLRSKFDLGIDSMIKTTHLK